MNSLYPIILFCYDRPWHTEQVLKSLKTNELAKKSKLIVFADGPKLNCTQQQLDKIDAVREIVKRENWCAEVEYNFAVENIGCRESIIRGITAVLHESEAVIVLEDDIVVSPFFLNYMNKALAFYKNRKSVFSISAYNIPPSKIQIPNDYQYDVYASLRILGWGWGTWIDRWSQVNWDKTFIPDFIKKNAELVAFDRSGDDMSRMLKEEWDGSSDAWDIQFAFEHFRNHAISIVPCKSYTNNIGLDGSGTHCNASNLLYNDVSMAPKDAILLDVLYEDKRIINAFYNYYCSKKRPIWMKIINFIFRKVGLTPPFKIKRKIYA